MQKEIWKDVKGYEGLYKVSTLGNIKSAYKKGGLKKLRIQNSGYYIADLYKNNNQKTVLVHRIIALSFIDNLDKKSCVNHIDGNRLNNKLSNLEWCTYKENNNHAIKTGLRKTLSVVQKDSKGNIVNTFKSLKEANEKTGISMASLSRSVNGIKRDIFGYKFYKI